MKDHDRECFRCRVPNGCDQGDDRCGIKRGVKYGIYPKSVLKSPSADYEKADAVGRKEIPLFEYGDGVNAFCEQVAGYTEPFIERERDTAKRIGFRYESKSNHDIHADASH